MLARPARARRGISVLEFVMAAALILAVLVASGVTLANVERSLAVSRARDGATLLASNILTQAAQFGCQLEVDPASASGSWKRCVEALRGEALTGAAASAENPAGDLFFTAEFPTGCTSAREATPDAPATPGCVEYKVLLSSRWLATAADQSRCQDPATQPSVLRRTLELRWRPAGAVEDVVYNVVTLQSAPSSSEFDVASSRGLLVRTAPGTVVTLSSESGSLARVAQACTDASDRSTGEAWFPYLPATALSGLTVGGNLDWSSTPPEVSRGRGSPGFALGASCAGVWEDDAVTCSRGS